MLCFFCQKRLTQNADGSWGTCHERDGAQPHIPIPATRITRIPVADKIHAIINFGLADDEDEARAILVDMGEIEDEDDE
jgi:hypothetical protein